MNVLSLIAPTQPNVATINIITPTATRSAGGDTKWSSIKTSKLPKIDWIVVPTIIKRIAVNCEDIESENKEDR